MKFPTHLAILLMTATGLSAEEPALDTPKDLAEHHDGSKKLSKRQDELSADVQQLAIEQTVEKVIALLKECEDIMGEATDNLDTYNTGGETIAAQTEVIEKIYEAAKEKQKQQGQGQSPSGGAMMDMMERMMGKTPEGDQPGDKPGDKPGNKPGDQGGKGQTGDSNSANSANGGAGDGKDETRRIPKSAGVAGKTIPEEFRSALDAYNRGAEKLAK
jgi:hypothetical protein